MAFASLPALTKQVVVASGYFDPLHYGHIEYLERSRDCTRPNSKIKSSSSSVCVWFSKSYCRVAHQQHCIAELVVRT